MATRATGPVPKPPWHLWVRIAGTRFNIIEQNMRFVMRRIIVAACALILVGIVVAPAFADNVDFKTADGIKKFWEQRDKDRGGGEGGS